MAYFLEPGHIAMVLLTPEQYNRMQAAREPNVWPVYFGARMAAHTFQDLAMKYLQAGNVDVLKKNIDLMLRAGLDVAEKQRRAGPTGSYTELEDDIERLMGGLYDNWKAGIWHGVGGAYSGAMDDFLNTGQLIYAAKTLAYHIAITPRMRRYWNQRYTPMVPSASMAWVLLRRGRITRTQFDEYCAYDGWDKAGAQQLVECFSLQPSPREAFYLWAKGQITAERRDSLYTAGGYDFTWHTMLTDNWYYTPTIYDLTRMADYVELDQIWAVSQMKRRGMRDSDIAKIWEMLEIRPLREEIRAITTKWVWRHKFGRVTTEELDDEFTEMKIKAKEKELLLQKAEMDYEDELVDEWIEILRWRFRTAVISEEEFREQLTDPEGPCRINDEKANLIVELEKAKGYYGYY